MHSNSQVQVLPAEARCMAWRKSLSNAKSMKMQAQTRHQLMTLDPGVQHVMLGQISVRVAECLCTPHSNCKMSGDV